MIRTATARAVNRHVGRLNWRGRSHRLCVAAQNPSNFQRCPSVTFKIRSFSSPPSDAGGGSHSDFAPQKKQIQDDSMQKVLDMIDGHVKENAVMLYMKGSPGMPQCGFSARVVQVLKSTGVDFASVNVLDYPSIREGVKQYSQWPTIPQLYVQGEFLGGCDIVEQMHESGELEPLLKEAAATTAEKSESKE